MTKKRLKELQIENEKLREALINCLMPLHCIGNYSSRVTMRNMIANQAKEALKQAKSALEFDSLDMALLTDTEEEEWEKIEFDLDAWLGSKDNEDEDDDD